MSQGLHSHECCSQNPPPAQSVSDLSDLSTRSLSNLTSLSESLHAVQKFPEPSPQPLRMRRWSS